MIGTAIAFLVATAVLPLIPFTIRRALGTDPGSRTAAVLDAATLAATTVLAAAAALFALGGGPATGAGRVTALCAAAGAAVTGGGFVVRTVLRAGGVMQRRPEEVEQSDTADGPLRGGRVIGYLERAAVAGTLLAGWPEGLAVILAVKSLARYPELRAPHASEQFIMGTFTSVLWAAGMSGVGYLLVN